MPDANTTRGARPGRIGRLGLGLGLGLLLSIGACDRAVAPAGTAEAPPVRVASRAAQATGVGAWRDRDVVVFVADSVAARRLGCYGGARDTSPALDALAARGVRFASARSQSSWTVPSVATCFTGLEQELHGVRELEDVLADEHTTLAEAFAARGYRTVGLVQTPVVRAAGGFAQGFARWRGWDWTGDRAELAVAEAERELGADADRPLFLYVHLAPPHMPYAPPAPFDGRFTGAEAAVDGSIEACRAIHRAKLAPDHPDVLRLAARYDEYLAYADALLGRVARAAEARGAVLIATSDHGEAFMEHGSQGHNATVYDEMVHVPLVVFDPRAPLPAGRVVDAPVSLLDLAPTLAELCDLDGRLAQDPGRSFAAGLTGGELVASPRSLVLSSRYGSPAGRHMAVVRRGKKLVWRDDTFELYDLERDPGELRDLAQEPRFTDLRRQLMDELGRWMANVIRIRPDTVPAQAPLDDARGEALRALGYLEGERSR